MLKRMVIIGAAGQSRELAWYVRDINAVRPTYELLGCVVSDLTRIGERDSADAVLGDYRWLADHESEVDALALGIGTPEARLKVSTDLGQRFPRFEWPAIVHPSARYDAASTKFAPGVMIGAGVVATVNVDLRAFAMLNFGCTIGHEARIGAGAVVNPGANVSGGVTVGEGALVGAGAVILQYRSIGAHARVGAGAVVTHDVPAGTTVVGVPARPIRQAALAS